MKMNRNELIAVCATMHNGFKWVYASNEELEKIIAGGAVPEVWSNGQSSASTSKRNTPTPKSDANLIEALAVALNGRIESGMNRDEVMAIVDEKLAEIRPTVIDVTVEDAKNRSDITGQHQNLALLVKFVACRQRVMMVGRAGSGKTTGAEKCAEVLGLDFTPISLGPQTSKSDLIGYFSASGNYVASLFRKAYEHGGMVLLDEIDAANAAVLTVINAALANGYCSFPDMVVKANSNFRVVAAANTWGRGADRTYVGRAQLDGATLDRFITIEWDYDEELERRIAGNDVWVRKVQRIREKATLNQVRHIVSPRASIQGAVLLSAGVDEDVVMESVVRKGLDQTSWDKIK